MSNKNSVNYSIHGLEKGLNWLINTIFYFRLLFVLLAIIILSVLTVKVWNFSEKTDKYKNISTVFALGSIVIGIFYSILNYEHNQIKYKYDIKSSKNTLSFNAACDWHRPTMVENLKITKQLYDEHKHLIDDNRAVDFFGILEKNETARSALVSILNYLECISLGVKHEILDYDFMKNYFYSVFQIYTNSYGFYINYRRTVYNAPETWVCYTDLAQKWLTDKK